MADSDSDASSTASHSALVSRPASAVKTDAIRFQRCYSRSLLLQLSKSNKIRPPQGLKPLKEWYGDYELPSLHPVNNPSNAGPNGRYSGRDGQAGGRRERERGERGATTAAVQGERYSNERESHARPATGAPATGQMGDFKLAGQRPFTLPKDSDSGDALTAGNRRRQNLRDLDFKDRGEMESKDRNWAAGGANLNSADRRRQLGGEFVKKDGRAAEEGGWRSSRETMQLGRERHPRDRLERPGFGERDSRSGQQSSGDRRRQPAWMDEEEPSSRRDGSSSTYQRRNQNGFQSNDAQPAWMADEPANAKGRFDDSLEALESKSNSNAQSSESHVDSIQAFKAQMKEMERRQKVQEQKDLRKEMGLPDLPDEEYAKKTEDSAAQSGKPDKSTQDSQPTAVKSVFADFLLPSSTSKEKEMNKVVEEKPRSSRFARMFAADAAAAQTGDRTSPANNMQSPAHNASTAPPMAQSSSSNNLLAALLPNAAKSPMQAPQRTDVASPQAQTPQTDNQSMARLMEMLHMSSTAPVGVQSPSLPESKQSAVPLQARQEAYAGQLPLKQQNRSRTQPSVEGALPAQARNDMRSPEYRQEEYNSPQQPPQRQHVQQSIPNLAQPSQQNREQIASPQSRLANRASGYGLNDPAIQQQSRRQEPLHAPVPPQQPNVNLLQLLAGQTSPPPGPLPPHLHNLPPPSHQQNPQRGQPMQSPHALGPFPPPGSGGMSDQQHAAQMASFLQAQPGSAGRPLPPPGMQNNGNMQFGRPPAQAPFMPPQNAFPPQQGPFQSSHQQQQHPGHLRSPSGHMNPAMLMQQQQQQRSPSNGQPPSQQQSFNGLRGESAANHPLPPPQAFAQQNALAQLLAQGGHPGQPYGGMRSPPAGPQGYQQQASMPPPPMHMHQYQNQSMQMHTSPPPVQQNQIDLMALLTGGANGAGFAGR